MARSGGSQMKKSCDCCKRYLGHLDEKNQTMSCFLRRMTSNPKHRMSITKEYAFAHFPHGNANVTLQIPGNIKKWHPIFYVRKDRRMHMLRGQWLDFVRDNHVQEGDICLFLPTNGVRRFMFTVYLLRATAATHSRRGVGFQRVGPCPVRPSAKMASEVHIEEPTNGEHFSSESDMNKISHEYLESEDSGD
nr:unnamed protein product [Digitaria exilis]